MSQIIKTENLLKALKLLTIRDIYKDTIKKAEKSNWGYKRFLTHLCESEFDDRTERKTQRLITQSKLEKDKSYDLLDKKLLPEKIRKVLPSLLEGDFVKKAENVLAFGLPGRGKTHVLEAIGWELILRFNYRVLFTATFKLVESLLTAKKNLELEYHLKKLDRYDVIILDDIGYVQQSREEMEVLFTFLAERYERKSIMITSNLVFSQWEKIFKDPMTTMAAVDRLVHHSIILEFPVEAKSIRAEKGKNKLNRKNGKK